MMDVDIWLVILDFVYEVYLCVCMFSNIVVVRSLVKLKSLRMNYITVRRKTTTTTTTTTTLHKKNAPIIEGNSSASTKCTSEVESFV